MSDLPPVKIQLVAEGIDAVRNAFQSIEASAKKMEDALVRLHKAGATKRNNDTKKEESERSRIQQTEASKRESAKDREFNKLARQTEKWHREEIAAEKRKNQQLEAEARKSASARQRFFSNIANKTVSNVKNVIGKAAGLAGIVAGVGGGFGVAQSIEQTLANQKTARQISLQTFNKKTGQYDLSPEETYSMSKSLAATTGFGTKESVGAIKGFGETGGYENVKKMMPALQQIGDLAMATGADFEQLSKSAGLIFAGDSTQSADDLLKKLRMLAEMGRNGAVDLEDMATSLNMLTASANQFTGDKMKNLASIGAFAQLARTKGTASSSAEALEAAKHLPSDIARNEKHFSALGIQTKDPLTGELTDPRTIVSRALAATGGDATKLHHLFGERAFKGIQGVQRIYQEERGKGLKAGLSQKDAAQKGLDEANKAMNEFTDANLTSARVSAEADKMRMDPSIKINQAFDQLRNTVGDKLVPELIKLIPKITELTPSIIKLLDAFVALAAYTADNPIKAVVAALALAVGASAVSAAIGAAFTALLAPEILAPLIVAGVVAAMMMAENEIRNQEKKAFAAPGEKEAEQDVEKLRRLEDQVVKGQKLKDEGKGDIILQGSQEQLDAFKKELSKKQDDMEAKRKAAITKREDMAFDFGATKEDFDKVTAAEVKSQAWLDKFTELQTNHDSALDINNKRLEQMNQNLINLRQLIPPPDKDGKPPTADTKR